MHFDYSFIIWSNCLGTKNDHFFWHITCIIYRFEIINKASWNSILCNILLLSILHDMTHLPTNGLVHDSNIVFSLYTCSCCCMSTTCCFFSFFIAYDRFLSSFRHTRSTRPKPPTPMVATLSKSVSSTRNSSGWNISKYTTCARILNYYIILILWRGNIHMPLFFSSTHIGTFRQTRE